MKDKNYRLVRMKYDLADKKKRGQKAVIWRLSREQREYIIEVLHYEVTPYLFKIRTRKLVNYNSCNSPLLKELHHARKRNKDYVIKKLSREQKRQLDDYGIQYQAEKYLIKLA